MAAPGPGNGPGGAPREDVVSKHGKLVVVIVFCILLGNAAPAVLQFGSNPREIFYTIVLVTLPYTGALVIVFLALIKGGENPYGQAVFAGIVFIVLFGLGAYFHLGISDVESTEVFRQIEAANYVPYGGTEKPPHYKAINAITILFKFYFNKYGLPLFVAATLASIVITWNIIKWWDNRDAR